MAKKMMKVTAMLMMLTTVTVTAFAGEQLSFDFTADYYSKYIWRGQNLDDDPAFQTGISTAIDGLTVGIWGSLELTNYSDNAGDFTEVDYYVDYSGETGIEGLGYSVGLIYYDFPSTELYDTVEVYWGFSADLALNPSVTVYHDVDEAEGTYISFGLSHSIEEFAEISPGLFMGCELGASLGWGSGSYDKYYWGPDSSELNDLAFSASFPMEIGDWTVSPSINYVTLVSSDIRGTDAYSTDNDYLFFGVGLSTSF